MRTTTIGIAAVALVALSTTGASAASRTEIHFTDHRLIESDTGQVTTSLADCPTATSVDRLARAAFTPWGGVFVGLRDIQCGDGTGFVVRLTATFGEGGSSGTWSIVDSYGDLDGLRGTGTLTGTPFDGNGDGEAEGIDDHFVGTATWTG